MQIKNKMPTSTPKTKVTRVNYTKSYDTVSQAVNDLVNRGYDENFTVDGKKHLVCEKKKISFEPDKFTVDEVYRFEGDSDPGDEAVVYGISSAEHNIKGVLVNGYGASSAPNADEVIKKLKIRTQK